MNDRQSNHFYLPNVPHKHPKSFFWKRFAPKSTLLFPLLPLLYMHIPQFTELSYQINFPNLLPCPQVSSKSFLPTLGFNSPDCTVLGFPFRTPLLLRTGSTYCWLGRCGLQPAFVVT